MVDDASLDGVVRAEAAGARYMRRETRGRRGGGAQRRPGAARHELVALHRHRLRPAAGLARAAAAALRRPGGGRGRAADRRAARGHGARRRARPLRGATRSPLDRGPGRRARHPVRARAVRARRGARRPQRTCASTRRSRGGEDVEFVWRAPYVRYEPAAQVAHDHRTDPRAWLARRVYYGRTAAGDRRAPPRQGAPAARLAVDDRGVGGARARRPVAAPRRSRRRDRADSRASSTAARGPRPSSPGSAACAPAASSPTRSPAPGGRSRRCALAHPARAAPARRRARDQDPAAARRRPRLRARPLAGLPRSTARSTRCCPRARGLWRKGHLPESFYDQGPYERDRPARRGRRRRPVRLLRDRPAAEGRLRGGPAGDPPDAVRAGARRRGA